jgi:hypothetical protein
VRLEQAGGPHDQIGLGGDAGQVRRAPHLAVLPDLERQGVAESRELEHGLQLMVAVGAAAEDVEEEIDLGGRRPAGRRCH